MCAAIGDYAVDGFYRLPGLLSPPQLDALRHAVGAAFGGEPDGPHGILRHNPWRRLPVFGEVLAAAGLGAKLCALLGRPRLRLLQDNLVWKTPATSQGIAWHQDFAYWPLAGPEGVTLWIALDDADPENGCLHYLPGSHLQGECAAPGFVAGSEAPLASALPGIRVAGREEEILAVPVCAGDGIAHHPLTLHMSPPNGSTRQRRAWSLSFVHAEARWCPRHAPHPFNHELQPVPGQRLQGDLFPLFAA